MNIVDLERSEEKREGWEEIRCPICNAEWYARGEYWECSHLLFAACTYLGFDLSYVRPEFDNDPIISTMFECAADFEKHLQANDYQVEDSFDDTLLERLRSIESSTVTHIMVDYYQATEIDSTSFITIFGYREE